MQTWVHCGYIYITKNTKQMETLNITRKPISKGTQWLYEVFAGSTKIGQKKTDREYYACAVVVPFDEKISTSPAYHIVSWIGRPDLITSNTFVKQGNPRVQIATLANGYGTELLPCRTPDMGYGLMIVDGRLYARTLAETKTARA